MVMTAKGNIKILELVFVGVRSPNPTVRAVTTAKKIPLKKAHLSILDMMSASMAMTMKRPSSESMN